MKNQLSKSERKYRSKIIAEEHLDKYWQGVLDEYMGRRATRFLGVTYKKCYFDKNLRGQVFLVHLCSFKREQAVKDAPDSIKRLTIAVSKLADKYVEMGNSYYD